MERIFQFTQAIRDRILPDSSTDSHQGFLASSLLVLAMISFYLFNCWTGEDRGIHVFFTVGVLGLYFLHTQLRIFIILALPFVLKDMIFDTLRYIPFEWIIPIHITELYEIDKFLFGINVGGTVMLPHEFILTYAHPIIDIFFGVIYHILDPVAMVLLLLFWRLKSVEFAQRYGCAFLLINFFAFATYYLYPAAAPWYVNQFGFEQPLGPVMGNAAGLVNFDKIVGMDVSASVYQASPVVFGAIPSMHAGFTMLGWIYSFQVRKSLAWFMGIYSLGMWVAALYLQHHYLIDLIIGIAYAFLAYFLIERVFRSQVIKGYKFIFKYLVDYGIRPIFGAKKL